MSESKFTPGPWDAKKWRVCAGIEPGQHIKVICDTATNNKTRTEENAANARLIAAAPDLLAACKEALQMCDEAYQATGYVKIASTSEQRLRLEAAIAKATGATP